MFPDVAFTPETPSVEHALVYDDRDLVSPLTSYFKRLINYWRDRLTTQHGRPPEDLSPNDRSRLVYAIAPDFDLVPTLRSRISEVDEELVRLTERQKELLEGLAEENRVVVKGGAGTGKTLLACEEGLRAARNGSRATMLCYGSRLADHLRAALEKEGVTVHHLHGLMAQLIRDADLRGELPAVDQRDLFDIYYPQLAIEALAKLDRFATVDVLILDEAQDMLKPTYVQFFDALVSGELARGRWRLFYDPNQDIFMGGSPRELEALEEIATCYRLTKNCRNTREIALATSFVSGINPTETLVADGPEVVEEWGRDDSALQKSVVRVLRDWIDRGVEPSQIAVLSPRTYPHSILSRIEETRLPRPIVDATQDGKEPTTGRIPFSTIAGFKGLEADAVLVVDIDDLSAPAQAALMYIGASRARTLLGLVLDETCRTTYTERVADVIGRLIRSETSEVF
jgi:superfamily I DNA/RNA helicase